MLRRCPVVLDWLADKERVLGMACFIFSSRFQFSALSSVDYEHICDRSLPRLWNIRLIIYDKDAFFSLDLVAPLFLRPIDPSWNGIRPGPGPIPCIAGGGGVEVIVCGPFATIVDNLCSWLVDASGEVQVVVKNNVFDTLILHPGWRLLCEIPVADTLHFGYA